MKYGLFRSLNDIPELFIILLNSNIISLICVITYSLSVLYYLFSSPILYELFLYKY